VENRRYKSVTNKRQDQQSFEIAHNAIRNSMYNKFDCRACVEDGTKNIS
jgi:hypothetical protein